MKKTVCFIANVLVISVMMTNMVSGQAKIKAYFTNPVNNSLSTGVNAVYLPSGSMADTIVAYIKRAKYSIDIAQYDYNQDTYSGAYANIAAAVDTAYAHGLTVRWIHDGAASNGGLALLNPGIHTLGNPSTSSGIMHNKFIIIDANSSNANDPILCTGSEDWSSTMFYHDYNNIIFIQDSALAKAYTAEFNMMWGSTTAVPNATAAKFGTAKTDIGMHTFTIAGHTVELYFSPTDNPDSHIASTINTANKDLYVGVYDMTRTGDAYNIVGRKTAGVYTLAVVDQYTPTTSSAVNGILTAGLPGHYVVYSGSYIYHNKMMVVDPSDTCSDPIVEMGSENWTSSGTNYNDENILIIHNDTLANIYYQSIIADYTAIGGGSFVAPNGICGGSMTTGLQETASVPTACSVYPNPTTGLLTVEASEVINDVAVSNLLGQRVYVASHLGSTTTQIDLSGIAAGIYLVRVNNGAVTKLVKE